MQFAKLFIPSRHLLTHPKKCVTGKVGRSWDSVQVQNNWVSDGMEWTSYIGMGRISMQQNNKNNDMATTSGNGPSSVVMERIGLFCCQTRHKSWTEWKWEYLRLLLCFDAWPGNGEGGNGYSMAWPDWYISKWMAVGMRRTNKTATTTGSKKDLQEISHSPEMGKCCLVVVVQNCWNTKRCCCIKQIANRWSDGWRQGEFFQLLNSVGNNWPLFWGGKLHETAF